MTQRQSTLFADDGPHTDRFGLLLLLAALSITILMFVKLDRDSGSIWFEIGWLAVTSIVGATLMLAFRASGASRRVTMIGDLVMWSTVVLVAVVVIATRIFGVSGGLGGKPSVAWAALAALSPVLVLRRVLTHKVVTIRTLAGSLAAYLLIAVAFAYIYSAAGSFADGRFFGVDEPSTSYMYFSLVTITTLGYGDLHPVTTIARYLATTEAILGQILLVTVVARLVGLYSRTPMDFPTDAS